jgi:hypothetical protein
MCLARKERLRPRQKGEMKDSLLFKLLNGAEPLTAKYLDQILADVRARSVANTLAREFDQNISHVLVVWKRKV